MSFRNRPVLDRKHRPRWQDELRTQQLTVAGFALAIAVAVGIFAAVAWSSFYNDNLRQVALVHGVSIERADVTRRADLIAAELTATYLDLNSQLGGSRDQVINQQLQAIQQALTAVNAIASDSIVTGLVLDEQAEGLGLSVPDDEIDAAVRERTTLPERVKLSLILVKPELDEGVEPGAEPTEQDWADARVEIDEVKAQLDDGAEFDTLATEHSDDASAQTGGLLGWITAEGGTLADYYEAAGDAEAGQVVGPLESEEGWYLLRVEERQAEQRDERLDEFLSAADISDQAFREFVRQDLLEAEFRDYFTDVVIGRYAPQRRVSQIRIEADQEAGAPAPKMQIRHLLAKPLPDEQDQSAATDEEWAAALERAEEFHEAASQPNADWYALAVDSDDPGSRNSGGSLGWYDPASLDEAFVAEFAEAAAELEIGELSEPVRSQIGYHVIQVTDRRVSANALATRLVEQLRDDPDAFAQMARDYSEDSVTAEQGGDLGWVLRYQYEQERQDAIFALGEPGDISDPVVTSSGIFIFKLVDTSPARFVSAATRDQVAGSGFSRWLDELQEAAGVWIDPELAPATTDTGGGEFVP